MLYDYYEEAIAKMVKFNSRGREQQQSEKQSKAKQTNMLNQMGECKYKHCQCTFLFDQICVKCFFVFIYFCIEEKSEKWAEIKSNQEIKVEAEKKSGHTSIFKATHTQTDLQS